MNERERAALEFCRTAIVKMKCTCSPYGAKAGREALLISDDVLIGVDNQISVDRGRLMDLATRLNCNSCPIFAEGCDETPYERCAEMIITYLQGGQR